jgi:hypothetical protein
MATLSGDKRRAHGRVFFAPGYDSKRAVIARPQAAAIHGCAQKAWIAALRSQ